VLGAITIIGVGVVFSSRALDRTESANANAPSAIPSVSVAVAAVPTATVPAVVSAAAINEEPAPVVIGQVDAGTEPAKAPQRVIELARPAGVPKRHGAATTLASPEVSTTPPAANAKKPSGAAPKRDDNAAGI